MKLKLTFPVKGVVAQQFAANDNSSYANDGLIGHTGTDVVSHYDDTIESAVLSSNKQYVYKILYKDSPNLMNYRSVYQIVEADDGVYEVSYGHCHNITCQIGPIGYGGSIATEGNTGPVYSNGREVTEAEKLSGSILGYHVHFQVRRLLKVRKPTLHSLVLENGSDFVDPDGFHFDVPFYDNGYAGCIDPTQFIGPQKNYIFNKNMDVGSIGTDVYYLQARLVRMGYGLFTPIGIYGPKTKAALVAYQSDNNISPIGVCGPLTRTALNS